MPNHNKRRGLSAAFLNKYEPKSRKQEWQTKLHSSARKEATQTGMAIISNPTPRILPPVTEAFGDQTLSVPVPIDVGTLEAKLADMLERIVLPQSSEYLVFYINELRRVIEAADGLNYARRKQYLDQLTFRRQLLEAHECLRYAAAAAARREEIEAAQARSLIAKYDAETEKARLSMQPPRPPSATEAEDPRAKNKARIKADLERLELEEASEIRKLTKLHPEAEWPEDVAEEVKRIQNMYNDAREELCEKLRRYL